MPVQPLEPTDPIEVGPYRLLARLGAGGMGRVYLARSGGGRTVAVKVVRAELAEDQEFRERFRREVAAAQAVSGQYTAPVVDAERDGSQPWLATAYVLGPSLTEAVAEHGPLPADSVRALGTGLAEALTAIHAAGIVHRDLKPSNVLLATDGPRVIDFGIARALEGSRLTSTGLVVGSPGFMSPEQVSGTPMGPPGDVFALGAVLVYAATGQGPFSQESDSTAALLYRVIHDEPNLTGLPDGLRPAIAACLAKNPADRPTPGELAGLLGAGQQLARAAWLPAAVASDIAAHAAEVMDMETPARGSLAAPADPRAATAHPATETGIPSGIPAGGTMRLGAKPPAAPAAAPAAAEAPPAQETGALSRRLLLAGGGAVVLAGLGGAAFWALNGDRKPTPGPVPPKPTGSASSGSPAPATAKSHAPGVAPEPLWTYKLATNSLGQGVPLVAGELVYLGGDGLYALQLSDGTVKYSKPEAAAGHLAAAGGTVTYGSVLDLVTLDGPTGSVLWKFDPKTKPGATEEVTSDMVFAADDKFVYAMCSFLPLDSSGLPKMDEKSTPGMMAVSRKDGSVVWTQRRKATADSYVNSLLAKNTLLYADSQKNLVARSTTDGAQLWFAETDSQSAYYPLVSDGDRVFTSSAANGIQAVDITKGTQSWVKTPTPGSHVWYSPAAVADGVVYVVLGGQTVSFGGTVVTPKTDAVLIAYKSADGTELWRMPMPGECSMSVSPVVVKDTLFVATPNKGINAVDTKTHKIIWTYQNGLTDTLDWKLATDGERLIAAQGERIYALPPV
ncbi:protein kinase domain-containing protein [Kitasatospora sp. McL0602]|uniref:serine/threonine-protein kinase n=1 Tax=Kitasatospora sp. McL0602 TaxID=3439530 RepID=UPI003F897D06